MVEFRPNLLRLVQLGRSLLHNDFIESFLLSRILFSFLFFTFIANLSALHSSILNTYIFTYMLGWTQFRFLLCWTQFRFLLCSPTLPYFLLFSILTFLEISLVNNNYPFEALHFLNVCLFYHLSSSRVALFQLLFYFLLFFLHIFSSR